MNCLSLRLKINGRVAYMRLGRIQIKNFRNFKCVDISLASNVVLLGENRAGKSNFLYAIRLVLDASLPDSARQLKLSDVWDGSAPAFADPVEVHLDFFDFDGDPKHNALLTDFRIPADPHVARLSYVFRKRPEIAGVPKSSADCEFLIYGGDNENRNVPPATRRRLALDLLDALRDAENQLGSWRSSPLRPLLEEAIGEVPKADIDRVAANLASNNDTLVSFPSVQQLENTLRTKIAQLSGPRQDIKAKLGFTPVDPLRIFRSIALLIDDGKRGISEASLGSANVTLLALKLAEFAWRKAKNESNFTILCVEEPEAHLHPHLQRAIFNKLFQNIDASQSLIVTTHSPTIASTAKLRSVVLLKDTAGETLARSLATLAISEPELNDIEHYLTATRAELLFARGIIFVEGDAEETLLSVFANSIGINLDDIGITVCNVGGVNFRPYVKLAMALGMPWSVITDWDPVAGGAEPLGVKRTLDLNDDLAIANGQPPLAPPARAQMAMLPPDQFRQTFTGSGIFLNNHTFEVALAQNTALLTPLLTILDAQEFGAVRKNRIATWRANPASVDAAQLLAMIADIGKGRLSGKLAVALVNLPPPAYITSAIQYVAACV